MESQDSFYEPLTIAHLHSGFQQWSGWLSLNEHSLNPGSRWVEECCYVLWLAYLYKGHIPKPGPKGLEFCFYFVILSSPCIWKGLLTKAPSRKGSLYECRLFSFCAIDTRVIHICTCTQVVAMQVSPTIAMHLLGSCCWDLASTHAAVSSRKHPYVILEERKHLFISNVTVLYTCS